MASFLSPKPPIHPPIRPYISQSIVIDNLHQYKLFIKNHHKTLHKLTFHNYDIQIWTVPQLPTQRIPKLKKRILRISKQIKHIHHLDLKKLYLHAGLTYLPPLLTFTKRLSRISSLSIIDRRSSNTKFFGIMSKCLKHFKSLKSLQYIITIDHNRNPFLRANKIPVKTQPLHFLLKYQQNKLQYLDLTFEKSIDFFIKTLQSKKFPRSITHLRLHCSGLLDPIILSPAFPLNNITSFELDFGQENSVPAISSLLLLIPQLLQLNSLSIIIPKHILMILSDKFLVMKSLVRLRQFKLSCNFIYPVCLNSFIQLLETSHITHLRLHPNLYSPLKLQPLAALIKNLPHLQVLKLNIFLMYFEEKTDDLWSLLREIDNLQDLRYLDINIDTQEPKLIISKDQFQSVLQRIFTKAIPLEVFGLQLNRVEISNKVFLDLLEALQPITRNLRKLKLNVGELNLDKEEILRVLEFTQRLHRIRSLKIKTLKMENKGSFMEFIDRILVLKDLRSLEMGKIGKGVSITGYIKGVEKILSKRGITKYLCGLTEELKRELEQGVKEKVDLVKVRNPYVERRNLPPGEIYMNVEDEYMRFGW